MEIYILREGKEIGPFSEVTTQTMLKQGSVVTTDLAWRLGLDEWRPLHTVLYPGPSTGSSGLRPPPPPGAVIAPAVPAEPEPVSEPATEQQKAFLKFMGIPFAVDLSKDQADLIANHTMQLPRDPARLVLWSTERLRLHPDLFHGEVQAHKESRAAHYLEIVQVQGAEFFSKVTKAHCQVLVGHLDARFPHWETHLEEVAQNYFFAAIAEKFPMLVKVKRKFKYPEGPGTRGMRSQPAVRPAPKRSLVHAFVRGLIFGLVVLGLLYGSHLVFQKYKATQALAKEQPVAEKNSLPPTEPLIADGTENTSDAIFEATPEATPVPKRKRTKPAPGDETAAGTPPVAPIATVMSDSTTPAADPLETSTTATEIAPMAATPPADAPPFETAPTVPEPAPTVPVEAPVVELAPVQPKTVATLTKRVEVQLPFGKAVLQSGTRLKIIAQEGPMLKVNYASQVVLVPVAATDYLDNPAAAVPAVPAVPVTPPTPPVPPGSLF